MPALEKRAPLICFDVASVQTKSVCPGVDAAASISVPPSEIPDGSTGTPVGSTAETMWSARLGNLAPRTGYCYQIVDGSSPVLAAPITFTTIPAPGDTASFSFDVIGDTGYNGSGSNPDQENLYAQMARSGASFVLTTGDMAYPDGSQNNYGDLVGMKITIGAAPVAVTSLGRYVETGNKGTHALSIYRASDGALISSTTLNLATALKDSTGYAYASLPAPVTLPAGGVYYIVSGETMGGDTWEGTYQNFPTLTHSAVATIQGAIYRSGTTWISGGSAANQSYVPVSFRYTGQ